LNLQRFVFTACAHIHPHRVGSRDGGQDRLADGLSALRQSLLVARESRAAWVFGGDMKQPHSYWPQQALNGILATLAEFSDVDKVFIPGNHDGVQGQWGSGLAPFRAFGRVVEQPTVIDDIAFWPFGPRRWDEFGAFADRVRAALLVAHVYVQGVALGPDELRLPGYGVPIEALRLDRFRLAVLGDIHKAQRLVRRRAQALAWIPEPYTPDQGVLRFRDTVAIYAGNPYMQNWGERGDGDKGVLLVDREAETLTKYAIEAPHFVLHDWTDRERPAPMQAVTWLERETRGGAHDSVRLRLPEPWLTDAALVEILRAYEIKGAHRSFSLVPVPGQATETRSTLSASMSPGELLAEYVRAKPPPAGVSPRHALAALKRLL
jgi:hypothetical protein